MAKLFSIASWNVEHLKDGQTSAARIKRVLEFLADQKPDIFGIYEVEGKTVFDQMVASFPGYTFQITEGDQTQEILVGVRKNLTAFITQKTEFRAGTTHMRPGQLVTVHIDGNNYAVLFLHLASGPDPRGMGLRDAMVMKALEFRKPLDAKAGGEGKANYLFLGDLNSMGLEYPFQHDIPATDELKKWDAEAAKPKVRMRRLANSHANSWSNGSRSSIPDSALDHVYASQHLTFKSFAASDGSSAEVAVRGWVDTTTKAAKDKWIKDFSDHNLLYLEIQG